MLDILLLMMMMMIAHRIWGVRSRSRSSGVGVGVDAAAASAATAAALAASLIPTDENKDKLPKDPQKLAKIAEIVAKASEAASQAALAAQELVSTIKSQPMDDGTERTAVESESEQESVEFLGCPARPADDQFCDRGGVSGGEVDPVARLG